MQFDSELIHTKTKFLHKSIVHILLILVVGLIVYSNTFSVPFHFDDPYNIVENPIIKDLQYFSEPSKAKTFKLLYDGFKIRFLGYLTFALNYKLHSIDVTGYHIVNLSIHIINALLVYWLVLLTFRTPFLRVHSSSFIAHSKNHKLSAMSHKPSALVALFSALIFVSHPIQTQAVTYIVQRFTSLATMFYLLSLVLYIKSRLKVEIKVQVKKISASALTYYLLSLICAVLAMKTKEIAFTLPVVIVLYEFSFFTNPKSPASNLKSEIFKRLLYLLPMLLTLLIIPLTYMGINKSTGDLLSDVNTATRLETTMSRWDYLLTQFRVIVTYIRLLFLPVNQNLDYDYPIYTSFSDPNVYLSFLFLLFIFGFGVYLFYRSRQNPPKSPFDKGGIGGFLGKSVDGLQTSDSRLTPYTLRLIAFGIFWFFITLSVESSIIPIADVIYEHRLYLPSIGIIIVFVSTMFYIFPRITRHALRITLLILGAVVTVFTVSTYTRNIVWKDNVTLLEDVVRLSPQKARVYYIMGVAYDKKGLTDKAIEQYLHAIRLRLDYKKAYNNLVIAYESKGFFDKALEYAQIAVKLNPHYEYAHNNLGAVYYKKGLIDKAIEHYQLAIRLNPNFAEAYNNLGVAYISKGFSDKVLEYAQIAVRLKPDFANAHYNLGLAYHKKGLIDKAIEHYQLAIRLNPNFAEAYNNLGNAYMDKGLTRNAIQSLETALHLKPNYPEAHYNLGVAYKTIGLIDKAAEHFIIADRLGLKIEN